MSTQLYFVFFFCLHHAPPNFLKKIVNLFLKVCSVGEGGLGPYAPSRVQHRTDGVGRAKATRGPGGVTTKALAPSFEGEKLCFK
jgi:hypothetical protein